MTKRVRAVFRWAGSMAAAGVLVLGGCANPESAVGFQEKDPGARLRAVRRAAETNDRSAVGDLINMLASDDAAERFLAIGTLKQITGETKGYDHAAPKAARQEAIKQWAEWYASEKGSDPNSNPTVKRPI